MKTLLITFLCVASFSAQSQSLYFPPVAGNTWDTVSPASLGWCQDKIDSLTAYLGQHNTKAFIVLQDGKIAIEKYYGTFTADSVWYWASAGKSLTSFLVGLAQEQGYLNINDSLPKYFGHGYTSCSVAAEDSIKIVHQLTMTTGFDDMYGGVTTENHCTEDSCLVCIAPPGSRWAYHNAPYTLTHRLIDSATHSTTNAFKTANLNVQTGITGQFYKSGYDDVYVSKARSFARFGLLMLNKGVWNSNVIMHDTAYFKSMINTSQSINKSYGYLWWLNGKSSYHLPGTQLNIPGMLCPHAPADMYAAMGKNEQLLNVVPSRNLVVIRMGNAFSSSREVPNFINDSIWMKLNEVFCNAMPVRLLSFVAKRKDGDNLLQWQTAEQVNFRQFEIERSEDAKTFAHIATVKSEHNNSNISAYSYTDKVSSELAVAGNTNSLLTTNRSLFYRLKMVDNDGKYQYSAVRAVLANNDFNVSVYPNPAKEVIQLSLESNSSLTLKMNITDMSGRVLNTQQLWLQQGSFAKAINIATLQPGSYLLSFIKPDGEAKVVRFDKL